jgi:predicted dehydrogenase
MSLRVGVVGVGHLGTHHARILAALPGVALAGVADTNGVRAQAAGAAHGVPAFTEGTALLGRVDAVTIAVPTESHPSVALPFLQAGVPVLVEKPIAASLADADRMIEAAAGSRACLAVGHTERFNPAVAAARALVADPRFVEVHRLGAFQPRSLDVDVVFDLMIHDLDILLSVIRSDVEAVEAVGVPVLTGRVDIANARIRFGNGCIANLTASRISRDRVRKIRFFERAQYVSVDCAARRAEAWRLTGAAGAPAIQGGDLDVPDEEPLARELQDFAEAVRLARPPGVTGEQARRALALAQQISDRIATSLPAIHHDPAAAGTS